MSEQACEQLTLFPVDSPASRFPLPGSEEAKRMTVTSGLKCSELCKNSGPLGSLVKMLLGSSAWSHPARLFEWKAECLTASRTQIIMRRHGYDRRTCCSWNSSETLKGWDTPSNRLLYRLVPSAPATGETESPWWPTPTVADTFTWGMKSNQQKPGSMHSVNLSDAVQMWPTPSASDCGRTAINPHLTANGTVRHIGKNGKQSYARLDAVAAMFPTPIATDWKNRGCKDYRKNREHQLQTMVGGQLNPAWVEWLMGFPPGWTDIG